MSRETPPDLRFATSSGVRPWNGAMLYFTEGEAWNAADPFVQAHPDLFAAEPKKVRSTDRVERATRRPGDRR